MSQKKDDVFELNFDDFNTGLLEKNLEEKGTNEFLNYYIKLNSDLEQKKKDLEKDKEQFASNIKKEIDKLNQKKAKLTKDYEKMKKELFDYEDYLDDYKNRRIVHSLRHTFVTEIQAKHTLTLVQQTIGHEHSNQGQTKVYTGKMKVSDLLPVVDSVDWF